MTRRLIWILGALVSLALAACSPEPDVEITYDPASLQFSGERALELETEFVTKFPNRDGGQPNNRRAVEWLVDFYTDLGLECQTDHWEIINYSRPMVMNNAICVLAGASPRQIVLASHHDQSPATIQGADNDGSGVAIMLHLAEIFAAEGRPRYTLVFLSSDGEEYGMLGTLRYVQTHPDPGMVIAGFSLDNLGKKWYDGMNMSPIGQGRNYGPIWLQITAREAARAAGDLWVPQIRPPLIEALDQAVPVSFMDQGPMVTAGIPALGFAASYSPIDREHVWMTYHTEMDTIEFQSAESLRNSGGIVEATVRQLLSMDSFPQESGPYLYSDASGASLRGLPLWAIFVGFVGIFFVGSFTSLRGRAGGLAGAWRGALPHFLALWLPLALSVLLLYAFVAVGLMDSYELYAATPKDPNIFNPRWPAVILFLVGLGLFFFVGRRLAGRVTTASSAPDFAERRSLALLVIGFGGIYLLFVNAFSLLLTLPLLFWLLIGGRRGAAWWLDLVLFLLGGLMTYALLYFFGFEILRNDFAILWHLMMMFSIGMVGFWTAVISWGVVAAGLSLLVRPPGARASA